VTRAADSDAASDPPTPTPAFTEGQVVTVFQSRRPPGTAATYGPLGETILASTRAGSGLVDFATFESPDEVRVALVTFATMEDHNAWRDEPVLRVVEQEGRDELYDAYSVQVGTCSAVTRWTRPAD
jgi:heme-degrading monooxygenase HmoA